MEGLRYRRTEGVLRREAGSEVLLFDPRDDSLHVLNAGAALVWEELAAPRSARELAGSLRGRFETAPGDDVERDVQDLLAGLLARQLVVAQAPGA